MDKPNNANTDQNRPAITLLVLMIALVVRFVNLSLLARAPFFPFKIGDSDRYDQWAHNIAAGDWIGQGVFYQAPLYPYFLGVIYSIFGDDIMTVRKIQAVIGAISCVLLMNAVWNLFNSRRAGIVAGIVMALYVPSIFLESMLQKSVLDLFFICLIIWLVSKINLVSHFKHWLALGAALGALCLTRENALALLPVFGLWAILKRPGSNATGSSPILNKQSFQLRTASCAMLIAGIGLVIAPVAIRNYAVGGELHITTSQLGPNFYIGNNPKANGSYQPLLPGRGIAKYEQADAVALAEEEAGRNLTPAEVSDHYMGKSLTYISEQPADWVMLLGRKTLMSLNASEVIDTEDQYVYEAWSPLMRSLSVVFHFGLLAPLAIIGLWRVRRRWRDMGILFLMAGLFQATMIAFFVFGRYRFPIVPLMIVFASPLIADLIVLVRERWITAGKGTETATEVRTAGRLSNFVLFLLGDAKQHWRPVIAGIIILIVCHFPVVSNDTARAVTYNNFGGQMLIRGRFDEAREYFEQSLAICPNNPLAHNNLGVAYREQQQTDLAIKHFRTALSLEPNLRTAKSNLQRLEKS